VLYSDGKIYFDTPFSRLLGKPPIMVAGMTPSTVKAGFVSAVLDVDFYIKLAGGSHYKTAVLCSKVAEIQKQIPPGAGITLMSTPDVLPTEITLIALLLFKFQVYSTFLHHYYHRPVTLSTFRLLYQSTIHHMASINALRLPLKKFFCP
jgi:hypothetical protein